MGLYQSWSIVIMLEIMQILMILSLIINEHKLSPIYWDLWFFHCFYSYPLTDLYIKGLHLSIHELGASQVANAGDIGDLGLIPGSGRSPGEEHDNPLRYSCLDKPMDRGVWWATVHGVTNSWTWRMQPRHMHPLFWCYLNSSSKITANLKIVIAHMYKSN